ncbi:MAG: NADH-quinone oxidoreductase subunit NuoG [Planctomycetota bacterium]|nr:NADH-quinone oxidoreductase subunit NuoG [Planctomycetota bacterium]
MKIYIENRRFDLTDPSVNLLEACLSLGFDVPYFCWHPVLRSVGACRQCAVKVFKDEADTRGRIVMSCMTAPAEGMRVSVNDDEAREFRAKVIEWLMLNHPHDCPICDEGGECHLQDVTVMAGHVRRQSRFPKRTHRNQDLGPLVNHEMNRCIQCYRCVRFYADYAGGRDVGVQGCHDGVYFGRPSPGPLESEFSGNLVEVCPTGVFTDKSLKRHYTRKWDLQTAPSVCVHCGLGCNTFPGQRYGTLRRVRTRYHREVNGYFLCDRGRYGYEFVNSPRRILQALLRQGDNALAQVSAEEAIRLAKSLLSSGKCIGLGSPRATLESNFALRTLVSPSRFFHPLAVSQHLLSGSSLSLLRRFPLASLRDVSQSTAVFLLGEDVSNTAPLLALALRQAAVRAPRLAKAALLKIPAWHEAALRTAVQEEKGPFFLAATGPTRLDDLAAAPYRAAPGDLAALGFAVAHALDPAAPAVPNLPPAAAELAERIAASLKSAAAPLIVSGPSCGSEALLHAAANVAAALGKTNPQARLCLTAPECNSVGLALLPGGNLADVLRALRDGSADTLIVLESDLYRHADAALVDEIFTAAKHVIVIDSLANATTARAELVLPAATFAESSGTLVNNEGRAQRSYAVCPPKAPVQESWRWLTALTPNVSWPRWEDILAAMAVSSGDFRDVTTLGPAADFRLVGQKIPRQPHRYSGRTAMTAHIDVREPAPAADLDTPLAFSMEGSPLNPPGPLIPRYWSPRWNSDQGVHKFQIEVAGPLQGGDPGKRIIEPSSEPAGYFAPTPPASEGDGEILFTPAWHVFGSEELSVHSPGIAELAPRPYVALGPVDAGRLGVRDGAPVTVTLAGRTLALPARILEAIPPGAAALPAALADLPFFSLPARGSVSLAAPAAPEGRP